jgi:hypothetical protein
MCSFGAVLPIHILTCLHIITYHTPGYYEISVKNLSKAFGFSHGEPEKKNRIMPFRIHMCFKIFTKLTFSIQGPLNLTWICGLIWVQQCHHVWSSSFLQTPTKIILGLFQCYYDHRLKMKNYIIIPEHFQVQQNYVFSIKCLKQWSLKLLRVLCFSLPKPLNPNHTDKKWYKYCHHLTYFLWSSDILCYYLGPYQLVSQYQLRYMFFGDVLVCLPTKNNLVHI